ncbi:alpha-D-xyloside xylohydrolase [Rhizomicrobium palustre]|uniref:Alpha-D-xyloside xylohydrolase n=1 Tax=Rhizomicrobium palustre TaxID=189966 RepID=A0A846N3G9_9PROT|nr:TIM-barrel domain-containing protein [Rhizomicrobium palustre]NIK89657.1 alpha-D-xyloside xylohydrolase [Rhizomicrobium palustre]
MQTRKIALMAAAVAALSATACSNYALMGSKPKAEAPVAVNWQKTETGVVVTPSEAGAKKVTLSVMTDSIIHVVAQGADTLAPSQSLIVRAAPQKVAFDVNAEGDAVVLKTAKVSAAVSLKTGKVVFRDASGKVVLDGVNGGQFTPVKVDGKDFFAVRQEFNRGTDEGFYGLGQHQNGQMNYNSEDVILAQHNMDVAVPFVVSTKNYGVLWDNYSITRFGYPAEYPAINAQLKIYDASGKEGGFTARYTDKGKLLAERVEADPNYQFIEDQKNFPPGVMQEQKGAGTSNLPPAPPQTLTVTYDGAIETQKSGVHKFRFYVSGYFKLWIDGKLVMDSWRQGWQGWYRNIDIPMTAGKKVTFKAEWKPEGGYLRFLHLDPMPQDERRELSLHSDVAKAIDYYYVAGSNLDEVIAGYRHLTGPAIMMPEWSYGFWQSRQRYETQDQLVDVFKKYRELKLPIDAIVQDWRYWKDPEWGSHDFDPSRFPNPKKMFDDVRAMHGNVMLVIWPKFYEGLAHFKEFDDKGLMYRYAIEQKYLDWVGPGYVSSNYDAYSKEARDIYWDQVQKKLDSLVAPDAWWMDNDEPDIHSNMSMDVQIKMRGPTVLGPGAEFYNTYPLVHTCGFYDHWQSAHPDKRTFILTRSGFAGLQRCNGAVWSGDIAARWSDMREQISAGVNFSMSGIPNWTFDIGGYSLENRYITMDVGKKHIVPTRADKAEWTELYTRWYQFGAFVPVFRSHGEAVKRETFEIAKPGSKVFNILAAYDKLRYRLLPYIYTIAADTYHKAGTMMRGLVMDFPNDPKVKNIADQYMFGPSFLVAPVTEHKATSRSVYLPAGTRWYDFYSGTVYEGGQSITAAAPLDKMPVFVKEGAIVPTGVAKQYTSEKPDAPLTLLVYPGKNGRFDIYEDDGKTLGYQRGAFARIPVTWDEASGTLSIGARQGSFPGMVAGRTIHVRWISGPSKNAANFAAKPEATVTYDGKAVTVKRP